LLTLGSPFGFLPIKRKTMGSFKDLLAYRKAFDLAMDIFRVSVLFPKEERYGLTSQMRRSSRSVCSNLAEGYRKRRYVKHFTSKLTDSDMENSETMVWIDFACSCGYIDNEKRIKWLDQAEEIGKLLAFMLNHPDRFSGNF
jgi:four helix bundle protein